MAFDFSKIVSSVKDSFVSQFENTGGNKKVIGIDIGSSSIKIVQLRDNAGVPTLDTYGELQLGPYAKKEIGQLTDLSVIQLTQAVVDIVRESAATAKNVALAISYGSSFATVISVPTSNPEDVGGYVSGEANKYIPVHLSTVTLDWFPIGTDMENSSTKVLLAAIHNDALKKTRLVVDNATLKTVSTEIEIFSTVRSSVLDDDKTVAVVDFGALGTRLYIVREGVVVKIHSLQMNASRFTQQVADTLKLDFASAEEFKRQGLTSNPTVQKIITNELERGLRELGRVIKTYEDEEKVKVDKVIAAGGGALLQGLSGLAKDVFGKEVVMSDPFSKVAYPAFLEDTLTTAGPAFSVAVGAALQAMSNDSK